MNTNNPFSVLKPTEQAQQLLAFVNKFYDAGFTYVDGRWGSAFALTPAEVERSRAALAVLNLVLTQQRTPPVEAPADTADTQETPV